MAVKLADSNLANYGSDEHIAQRREAADKEPAWDDAGKEAGVQIWRVEKFEIKEWPKKRYGEFYNGDSYIILHTKIDDEGKKSFDVHFWLGGNTTQDEAGTAAYKTVELDDKLRDAPVQYREVEGMETKRFRALFPKINVLEGGIESGFNHVEPHEYKPRLLHVMGEGSNVQVYQVKQHPSSLNNSDSFVLDAGTKVYQFNGGAASAWEKREANNIVDMLQSERGTKIIKCGVIDGMEDDSEEAKEFWDYFGEKPDSIADVRAKQDIEIEMSIQKISDANGGMQLTEAGRGKLYKSMLDSDDVFLIDAGSSLFVWIGQGANAAERARAFERADEYLRTQGRGECPCIRVPEGKEPSEMWDCFSGDTAPSSGATGSSIGDDDSGCCVVL